MALEEEKTEEIKTVIVAQKDPEDLHYARVLLDRIGGFRVIEARTASDVIRRLPQNPNLILVDTRIEGNFLKAMELMRRMQQLNHVGVAALTGDQEQVKRCVGKGFNGFIVRPSTPENLLASVWKILASTPPLPGDGSPAKLDIDIDYNETAETCKFGFFWV